MRTLAIAAEHPWPTNSGSRLRLANTLAGLSRCGPTDLFSIVSDQRSDFGPTPQDLDVERVAVAGIDDRTPPADWMRSALVRYMPFEIPLRQRSRVSRALADFVTGSYDLVWCFRVRAWVLAGEPALGPSVVDLDDLEDQKIRARLSSAQGEQSDALARLRHMLGAAFWSADAHRWQRLHERIASRSSATVVCSELDAKRSAIPGVRVIPNGYEPPDHPAGHLEVRSPPTVLFHGTLRYPPNADAARFLVEDVTPRLRALVPDVRIRLVGLASEAVLALDHPPEVTVVGQVPDITAELASADVVVVPMRFASGTRVKILEAFANRVPVVSTTCGAEGLGVQDGVHLLIADQPDSLARALAASLTDAQLREKLVTNAQDIFICNYRSESIREMVTALAKEVAGR